MPGRVGSGERGGAERCLSALQVMAQILKDMGITEYEPRVINQMLEFAYSKGLRGRAGPGTLPGPGMGSSAAPGEGNAEWRRGMLSLAVFPWRGSLVSLQK